MCHTLCGHVERTDNGLSVLCCAGRQFCGKVEAPRREELVCGGEAGRTVRLPWKECGLIFAGPAGKDAPACVGVQLRCIVGG